MESPGRLGKVIGVTAVYNSGSTIDFNIMSGAKPTFMARTELQNKMYN